MWWQYLLVFIGSLFFDVVPVPFPPAFTIMIFLQILFAFNILLVITIGVVGSILGRYILTLYIPLLAGRIFKQSKTEDVEFLGKKMKEKGWKSQFLFIPSSCYLFLLLPYFWPLVWRK